MREIKAWDQRTKMGRK